MDEQLYFLNVRSQQRESAEQFMLGCILKSRLAIGHESSGEGIDAAINIYLAHLLMKVMTPGYQEACHRYVSSRTTDLYRLVEETGGDAYRKFFLYQINADYILLFLSIFEELGCPAYGGGALYRKSAKAFEGYGRTYYSFASSYYRLAQQRATDLSEVLSDLSSEFSKYRDILQYVRRDYFNLLHRWTDSQLGRFMVQLSDYEHSVRCEEMMDAWLDLYGAWLQSRDGRVRECLEVLADELRALDPAVQLPSLT